MIYELKDMKESDVYAINLRCVRSYIYFHESKYYKSITDQVLSNTKNKWVEAVRWWVSNSARATRENASGFVFSLDKNTYIKSVQKIGYRKVSSLVYFLEGGGYIDLYKGFVKTWKTENGRTVPDQVVPSCMIFRERTLQMWHGVNTSYNLWKDLEESDLAIIRKRKTKDLKSSRGHAGFKEIKNEVRNMNQGLVGADITFNGKPIANIAYRRIFTDDLNKGGRLYTLGGGVQLLPQKVRASSLMIDGEPVIELDYSCIHPNICYQLMLNEEGLNVRDIMGDDFSPYDADLSFVEVDEKLKQQWESKTGELHNPIRSLSKLAILIGMNSDDINSAAWTLGNKVKADRAQPNIEDQLFYAISESPNYGDVLKRLREHNDLIKDRFFKDAGILLQTYDSNVMLNIIGAMGEKGHTVLAYHDSALVKASAEQDLYEAMVNAWLSVFGDTTFCKIDKK